MRQPEADAVFRELGKERHRSRERQQQQRPRARQQQQSQQHRANIPIDWEAMMHEVVADKPEVLDCWEEGGAHSSLRFTWDLQRNDNLQFPNGIKPRARYDRMYFYDNSSGCSHDSSDGQQAQNQPRVSVSRFRLLGTKRLAGGTFPSDHFGILVDFKLEAVRKS